MTTIRTFNPNNHDGFSYAIDVIKRNSNTAVSILTMVDDISVWQSLFAKSMQAQLLVTDMAGYLESAALQPNDQIRIVMYKDESIKIDKIFDIISISAGLQTDNKQGRSYVIGCLTAPAVYNKVSTVNESMRGLISEMVRNIATTKLKIDGASLDIEASDGDKYNVVMPRKSPFAMIQWCANHALSSAGGVENSFYLFYEDRDKFRFKTIKSIISDATTHQYVMAADSKRAGDEKDLYRIKAWRQNQISDNTMRLDAGMYENELLEFDIFGRTIVSQKFDYRESIGGGSLQLLVGSKSTVDLVNNFDNLVQLVTKAKGSIKALKIRSSEEGYGELNTYGRKHNAMIAQKAMFNQISFTFMMAGNPAIKAGDLIDVVSASLSAATVKEYDMLLNNKFLVGNVRTRVIGTDEFVTVVDVFSDGLDLREFAPS